MELEKDSVYKKECVQCEFSQETKRELCSYCMAQKIIKGKWNKEIFTVK